MEQNKRDAGLDDFVAAQDAVYEEVIHELQAGRKRTHWIWFVFPQLAGLGTSSMAQKFGLASVAEARTYLDHPVLGRRLRECTRLMLAIPSAKIEDVMGYPDNLKFRSSMTLFDAAVRGEESIFDEALEKFFGGERDPLTIDLLNSTL